MIYRRFGRTGLQMPVFSCGGMRYQHAWSDVEPDKIPDANQKNLEATIHRSIEVGINHIETARGYGTSEMQLGSVLPQLPRSEIIVQTKVSPRESAAEFLETFETSMKYLRLDHVDLLSLHGINTPHLLDLTLRPGGCMDICRRLQRDGRVRFVGFSTHGPAQTIVDAVETGEFDYFNVHWYWVNRRNWRAIEAATRHDMGVFIISPNDKGGKLYAPPPKLVDLCRPFSPMVFNDLFCLQRPEVHTLSLGASKPGDFDEHIHALDLMERADASLAEIDSRLVSEMHRVLGRDWCENWETGIPECDEIPGEINVWEILRLYNLAKSLDLVDFGKMRYNLLGNADHWFPGNQAVDFDGAALRDALHQSPFRAEIPGILREAHALLHEAPQKRLSES
jgi:predicted aldo/keto reductase-like oxidoreductase